MKKIITSALCILAVMFAAKAAESDVIEFSLRDGYSSLSTTAKNRIEENTVKLLTMMSNAQRTGSKLNFSGIGISPGAINTIQLLWKYQPLCVWRDDDETVPFINENLLRIPAVHNYQVRNIPVRLFPRETPGIDKYSEIVLNYSANGTIEDFNIAMDRKQYQDLMDGAYDVQDKENRMMLAFWMDQLKMAYETKDLKFLESLFDKDAHIITGVRSSQRTYKETQFKNKETYEYFVKNREQYMQSMKHIFKINKDIRVNFIDQEYGCNDIKLTRNANGDEMPRYYMVWCTQEWMTTRYKDKGRLFVLWDFKDPEKPVIMVRAWTNPDDPKQFSDQDFILK